MSTRSITTFAALAIAALLLVGLTGCPSTPSPAATATVAVATTAPAPTTAPATAKPAATTAAVSPAATTAAVSPAAGTPAAAATTAAISPAAGTAAAGATTASAATIAQGQQLYQTNCARCHGPTAEGGLVIGSATSASIRAPDLDQTFKSDPALVRRAILDGKDEDNEDLDPAMPRWRGTLTDDQVNSIIAWLLTLKD